LVSVGVVHGLWTDRWSTTDASVELKELGKLPHIVGKWEGRTVEQSAAQEALPESNRNLLRRYVNRVDGTVADVLLARGRPGPLLMFHTPPECYPAAGYELIGQTKRYLSQSQDASMPDEFWVATFKKSTDLFPITVRVYWAWSAEGKWQAPASPRLTFAPYPTIYKMYVVQTIPNENAEFENAPVHDLVKELTTAARRSLFSSTSP